ncbi:threonine dehydratase [Burkholderia pseudomallei]|nr:threonine dehydratase [Burkholderia pseudomallei]
MEILRQHQGPIHAIFVPIGGGGLAAGVAAYVKAVRPEIKVIGVQTDDSCAMKQSLAAGRRVELTEVGLFSDGTAVKLVGEETFRLCAAYLDEVVTVDTDALCAAIKDVFQDTRSVLEPAGSLAVAGAKRYAEQAGIEGETLVAVTSGANMNFDRMRFVAERAEVGEAREAVFAVTIPEERGSFKRFCALVGERNVTEFNYRIADARSAHPDALCAAIKDVFQDTRSVLEPAGSLAVAGAKRYAEQAGIEGETLVAVTSGANMNFDRMRFVAERAEVGEAREAVFAVTIPEERGSFKRFCALVGERNVTEFNYRIADARSAHLFVGVQIRRRDESDEIAANFAAHGFTSVDLSGDELSKQHIRYMVGGRSPLAHDERLFRFEFPERPGALMKFLSSMAPDWNISLFHYRNQGGDASSILVGLQVPRADHAAFDRFLAALGYPYREETGHPAYRLFLG